MIKRFEVYLGNAWQGWQASETVSISKREGRVVITTISPDHGTFKTFFNLDVLPAYTLA